jgi:chemotaxis signal transduction protein
MTAVIDRMTEVQDQIIDTLAKTKAPVTNAVSTVVGYVVDRVPTVPAVPFAEQIPTPKELIDNQAKFAAKLVSTNKSVALAAAKAAAPLTDQLLDRSVSPVRSAKAATAA